MFVDPTYAASPEYQAFWRKLNGGEFIADGFKRIGKGGKEVFIQASYNPIFDLNRKVMKVVKFATDISDLVELGAGLKRMAASDPRAADPEDLHAGVRESCAGFQRRAGESQIDDDANRRKRKFGRLRRARRSPRPPTICRAARNSRPPA